MLREKIENVVVRSENGKEMYQNFKRTCEACKADVCYVLIVFCDVLVAVVVFLVFSTTQSHAPLNDK